MGRFMGMDVKAFLCSLAVTVGVPALAAEKFDVGPCKQDAAKHCAALNIVSGGAGKIKECLVKKKDKLSAECRAHVDAKKEASSSEKKDDSATPKLEDVKGACSTDIKTLCSDASLVGGGVVKCLKDKTASLTAGCKSKISPNK